MSEDELYLSWQAVVVSEDELNLSQAAAGTSEDELRPTLEAAEAREDVLGLLELMEAEGVLEGVPQPFLEASRSLLDAM